MSDKIPEDLKEMYAFAIAWRHEFGSERRYGAATVETLIERIGRTEEDCKRLREALEQVMQFVNRPYSYKARAVAFEQARVALQQGRLTHE